METRGNALLETVIGLTIVAALGTALLMGVRSAHSSGDLVERNSIAENLARNQMEYVFGTTTGDIGFNPGEHLENGEDRWRFTWELNPKLVINSGVTKTVSFSTTATVQRGDYWNDVLLTIDDADYAEPIHTGPPPW